jgi:hypothetical protein
MRDDSDKISIFFIDCINDVTGSNNDLDALWDTQAKGIASLYPTTIGESLITLFENDISDLNFIESMIIFPKIKDGFLKDENKLIYKLDNFKEDKQINIFNGLLNEYKRRNDIDNVSAEMTLKLNEFLSKVIFVVALEKEKYIREIIHFKNKDNYSETFYNSIFDEIRDYQSALKNICIEGVQIAGPSELLQFEKHIRSNDIRLMVLNRFVGTELFKNNHIPISYIKEVQNFDNEDIKDLIQENNSNLSRAFFNKNNKRNFWILLENIIQIVNQNKDHEISVMLSKINIIHIKRNPPLDENSLLFFIAIIKDGLNVS